MTSCSETAFAAAAPRNAKLFHLNGLPAWLRDRTAKLASGRIMDKLYRYDAVTAAAGRAA